MGNLTEKKDPLDKTSKYKKVKEAKKVMIKFVLMVNKQGQTRLAQYYEFQSIVDRVANESEIIRKCLGRNENQVRSKITSHVLFNDDYLVFLC